MLPTVCFHHDEMSHIHVNTMSVLTQDFGDVNERQICDLKISSSDKLGLNTCKDYTTIVLRSDWSSLLPVACGHVPNYLYQL